MVLAYVFAAYYILSGLRKSKKISDLYYCYYQSLRDFIQLLHLVDGAMLRFEVLRYFHTSLVSFVPF